MVCFGIKPEDYSFFQAQAKAMNSQGGIVTYIQRGNKLPSLDFIRAYQTAIKISCKDKNQSARNDETIFKEQPTITFFNKKTREVAIRKIFIAACKLADRSFTEYLKTGNIGDN